MSTGTFIHAICTPLHEDETLHRNGLEVHLRDQWDHGADGVLVGGSMGMMQLLRDETYRDLVEHGIAVSAGRGEVLVGAGDTSFGRTRDRIEFLNRHKIDGVVVLAPYLFRSRDPNLEQYFKALADVSKAPLYIYDLPVVTGVNITLETYAVLATHPNIRGAKISGRFMVARQLIDTISADFRVIIAEPDIVDMALAQGFDQHLDGIFAVAPHIVARQRRAVAAGDMQQAMTDGNLLVRLRNQIREVPNASGLVTEWLKLRGVQGQVFFTPTQPLTEAERNEALPDDLVRELSADTVAAKAR